MNVLHMDNDPFTKRLAKAFEKAIKLMQKKGKLSKQCLIFGADYFVKLYIIISSTEY